MTLQNGESGIDAAKPSEPGGQGEGRPHGHTFGPRNASEGETRRVPERGTPESARKKPLLARDSYGRRPLILMQSVGVRNRPVIGA